MPEQLSRQLSGKLSEIERVSNDWTAVETGVQKRRSQGSRVSCALILKMQFAALVNKLILEDSQ